MFEDDELEMPAPRKSVGTDALERLRDRIEANRRNPRATQATYLQDKAVKTAEALGDVASVGIYLRLYKRFDHVKLDACRDWVLSRHSVLNRGRLFVATYKRFLNPPKFPQRSR